MKKTSQLVVTKHTEGFEIIRMGEGETLDNFGPMPKREVAQKIMELLLSAWSLTPDLE